MPVISKEFFLSGNVHFDYSDKAVRWLSENIGPYKVFQSAIDFGSRAGMILQYRIFRGSEWRFSNQIVNVGKEIGEGWEIMRAYTNGWVEVSVKIDDELMAVQFKLAVS